MSHRLQVLLDEDEIARIRAGARRHRVTVSEYVRQALREGDAREPSLDAARKLMIVREAATLSYPTADIDEMESDIVRGYLDDG